MIFAKIHSGQSVHLTGQVVDVEVDISRGLHSFTIVGLPDKAIEEARDRISAAIKNSGYVSPKQKNQRVVISLAPADIKKEGTHFDLAMAIGYLLASNEIKFKSCTVSEALFVGELSLDGSVRKIRGAIGIVHEALRHNYKKVFIPTANESEVSIIKTLALEKDFEIIPVASLAQTITHILGDTTKNNAHSKQNKINSHAPKSTHTTTNNVSANSSGQKILLNSIIGQPLAKRAVQIAAAGKHNILMSGPPGTGKTMLARALQNLLPKLSVQESIEVTTIHSALGTTSDLVRDPPFRAPHHTSSYSALIGGGSNLQPGEITLAHRGVLFLDEFPEFDRRVIETLRQPLEARSIQIARTKGSAVFPANFLFVAAMNPCPCGYKNSTRKICSCTAPDIARYTKKISGPIIDRIDLFVEVADVIYRDIAEQISDRDHRTNETMHSCERVSIARAKQYSRIPETTNAELSPTELSLFTNISPPASEALLRGAESFNLSLRAYHRVWRVARTIADLDNSDEIKPEHVLESFQYRMRSG